MQLQRLTALFGKPEFLQSFHGWGTVFWFILWGSAAVFGWINQVKFVSHISMIALILGSWSAWQAARVEVRQDQELDEQIEKAVARVVKDVMIHCVGCGCDDFGSSPD